ncbi:hypothetical protein Kpol_1024p3 [Vanderwaltozyma polyspora DSM 70294]|uniref:VWFA domain-containing protein n=1 Tax=Vanderwaltozyma polyspora (strain ATCC 22028 / DSM 70294 / BCRC 21397 / CBS 2163 / NBRC 10782 / NRRL Y-8283 / UCD 57-17) TaxID=436907 RepID=A7TLG5_VANPO|nr:uncharacterized protein Kpol_1024p3 [Vanderwaltozyma polyspora DSM 70294]EDO16851.1 hypothetical protein Kpol_1024p3 [Vanderwaltozyma polyspora DSM 70294]
MVLEATVLIVDNSEYSRNGDFPTTRFEAQMDSVEFIFQAKRNSNPENTLALISSAGGTNPQVLSTFTSEFGKILSGLNSIQIDGSSSLLNSIQIAQLILKHRQNKLQHQRIIIFVCSPIQDSEKESLLTLAKKLKKNNIAIDIINFGEIDSNTTFLQDFISTVNNTNSTDDQSHLLTVQPSAARLLYENIASSPIIMEHNNGTNMMGGSNFDDNSFMDFGVDPSMDPELAMALRLSMEEEQQRQERLRQEQEQQPKE